MKHWSSSQTGCRGFTLIELAVVLIIVTLLTSGLMMTLSAQQEASARAETQRRLEEFREALIGFAAANGRLPCPAISTSHGIESFPLGGASGQCSDNFAGFLPAATLGISPTDGDGFAIDSWGNRIRYAVSRDPSSGTMSGNAPPSTQRESFTLTDGMKAIGMSNLHPDLHICAGSTGAAVSTATAQCSSTELTHSAIAVIFSLGRNGSGAPSGIDEQGNIDGDRVFASHIPSATGAPGGEFDDLVTWLSPNILYSRLITAGRLP